MNEMLGEYSYQVVKNWSRDFKLGREACEQAPGAKPQTCCDTRKPWHNSLQQISHNEICSGECGFTLVSVNSIYTINWTKKDVWWVSTMLSASRLKIKMQRRIPKKCCAATSARKIMIMV